MDRHDAADRRPGRPRRLAARPVRLAVVGDHEIVVAGITAMLAPYGGRVRVVELSAAGLDPGHVDVVLYDTDTDTDTQTTDNQTTDTRAGLEVLLGCAPAGPDRPPGRPPPRVAVFSWKLDPARVDTALQRGAAGYLSKGLTAADLVAAVEQVHAGERVRPQAGLEEGGPVGDWPGRLEGLSIRESETLALITQGLSNLEIAERSYLSVNSVKTYIRSAYRKIGVTRRSQAVLWGLQHGFDVPVRPAAGSGPAGSDLTSIPPSSSQSRPPSAQQ